jgi:CRP/FNR family transcriptional regulator, cyclic AMP receptor protein
LDTSSLRSSASPSAYDPAVALDFFQSAGKPKTIAKGATIFTENRKGVPMLRLANRIYLLLKGEVGIFANGERIAAIREGEVFGEMASMGQMPRSASAVATAECRVIALDDRQFRAALARNPGFALMLLSVMAGRLRDTLGRLGSSEPAPRRAWRKAAALDTQLLADLEQVLGPPARFRHAQGKVIMREGQVGVALYVVLRGRVAISIGDCVVEKVARGGVFGEMSLVDRHPRLATAVAETDCALLAISRHMFLHLVKASPKFGAALLRAVGGRAAFTASRLSVRTAPAEAQLATA